jgi:NADPH:quinone reductase
VKLIQVQKPGPPGVMQLLDVPVPELKPGEVLIRAHAIGVGMPDCLIRAGTYSWMPPLPVTPGTELAGTIEKVGAGVTSRQEGQRVYTAAAIMRTMSRRRRRRLFFFPIASRSMPRRR